MSDSYTLNERYKLESLGILPDYCLQEIFNREVKNITAAKIAILLSAQSRKKLLSNLNLIRAAQLESIIADYDDGNLNISHSSLEKTCEWLMDRVQQLKESGLIIIPEVGLNESLFNLSKEFETFSDNLPRFNFNHNDLHDLISWWNLAAKNIKSIFGKRAQVENLILERLDDEFSSQIFSWAIDDIGQNEFSERSQTLRERYLKEATTRLNLMETFFTAIGRNLNSSQLATKLAYHLDTPEESCKKLLTHGPLLLYPAVKIGLPPEEIAISLYKLKLIYDTDGVAKMEEYTRKFDDHFFRKCMSITISEMNWDYAGKIIKERKKAHRNEIDIKLKMITDAAQCIRNNISPYIMLELMSSYTVYDFEE